MLRVAAAACIVVSFWLGYFTHSSRCCTVVEVHSRHPISINAVPLDFIAMSAPNSTGTDVSTIRLIRPDFLGGTSPMCIFPNDYVSNHIRRNGVWEPNLLLQLMLYAPNTFTARSQLLVVDLGANIGAFTLFALSKGFRVFSIEMQVHVFQTLSLSVALQPDGTASRWRAANAALSSETDQDAYYTPQRGNFGATHLDFNGATNSAAVHMRTQRIDDIIDDNGNESIFFLKVDIEGLEPKVIPTFDKWFRRGAISYVAIEARPDTWSAIKYMYERGMECGLGMLSPVSYAFNHAVSNDFWTFDEAQRMIEGDGMRAIADYNTQKYIDVFCKRIM